MKPKMRRVVTVIKAKGQPPAVLVQRVPDTAAKGKLKPVKPVKFKQPKLYKPKVRITPERPRIS